jgi:hypothetical protein
MEIFQTASFRKAVKKLHVNQKKDLDAAVKAIAANPALGELKTGDIAGVQVYKFKMAKQLALLVCEHNKKRI